MGARIRIRLRLRTHTPPRLRALPTAPAAMADVYAYEAAIEQQEEHKQLHRPMKEWYAARPAFAAAHGLGDPSDPAVVAAATADPWRAPAFLPGAIPEEAPPAGV